jgi:peptidoglycan hydrolase FlgJ
VAIKPPSDLVLDVAAAANPAKLREATERLANTGSATTSNEAFQAAMEAVAAKKSDASAGSERKSADARPFAIPARDDPFRPRPKGQAEALEKFEAFFLQTALQEMLPKDAQNVYGSGTAGEIWRSMLAEQIAAQMAHSTKFGIAERLADNHFITRKAQGSGNAASLVDQGDGSAKNLPFLNNRRPGDTLTTDPLATGGTMPKRG